MTQTTAARLAPLRQLPATAAQAPRLIPVPTSWQVRQYYIQSPPAADLLPAAPGEGPACSRGLPGTMAPASRLRWPGPTDR